MKKTKRLTLAIIAAALTLLCALLAFTGTGKSEAHASSYYPVPTFEFKSYNVIYDVRADRTMDVTLEIEVYYLLGTGILYDIPVNAGDRVRNLKAYEIVDGRETYLAYSVKQEIADMITVDMGDYTYKSGETHTYRVKYEYAITRPQDKNWLYLNAVSFESEGEINDISVTLNLPDGMIKDTIKCYVGRLGTDNTVNDYTLNGNTITYSIDHLSARNGVGFDIEFKDGALSTKTDMTPFWVAIIACVLLAVLFAVKLVVFNKQTLTPVINTQAPDDMDPLIMGKLIDNKVDNSDVTSLIYYWANKGYLKIDMRDESDPTLLRVAVNLPDNAPDYQKQMYFDLFRSGDMVRVSSLTNRFYTTVEKVTRTVNSRVKDLYDKKSATVSVLFAILGALIFCVTPILLGMFTIHIKFIYPLSAFMIVPAVVLFTLCRQIRFNKFKNTKKKKAILWLIVVAIAVVSTAVYTLLIPSYIVEILPKILLCAVGYAIIAVSSFILSPSESYTEKLNSIVGFREFIMTAEKDKLEAMLESNPEFYYQVLPYAQVLGVSDVWENKFASLTVAPPNWTTTHYHAPLFRIAVFNASMRNLNTRMNTAFVSRPSSGSYSGGGRHGSFGGGGGHGHGGGGFRGR